MRKSNLLLLTIFILFIVLLTGGCNKNITEQISIAEQYGLAYAPVQLMKEKGFLEKNHPGLTVNWSKLSNTAAIREAMLAGDVDIGFMAIPPFLIGRDKGMEWKIISGLSESPLGLTTYRENITSIEDITAADRIALPQPGSIQHILLSMACAREFGDATRFDDLLVTMAHPDGMNALLARKEITAHFTSPPYIFEELQTGEVKQILSGKEAMGGEFTFIVGTGIEKFHDNNPEIYRVFVKSLQEAVEFINSNPQEAAAILADNYNLTEDKVYEYITWPGMKYTTKIKGLSEFTDFMYQNGYLSSAEYSRDELLWEEELYVE